MTARLPLSHRCHHTSTHTASVIPLLNWVGSLLNRKYITSACLLNIDLLADGVAMVGWCQTEL